MDLASTYNDRVVRQFTIMPIVWGVVGMLVGVIIALQIAWWPANLGLPWTTFGRLRPLHTNAVIFAFVGNGMWVTSLSDPDGYRIDFESDTDVAEGTVWSD